MSARRFVVALAAVVLGSSLALGGVAGGASSSTVKPKAGYWHVTYFSHGSGSGTGGSFQVMNAGFTVSSNHKKVSRFSFSFEYSAPIKPPSGTCSGNGVTTAAKGSAIKKRKFSDRLPDLLVRRRQRRVPRGVRLRPSRARHGGVPGLDRRHLLPVLGHRADRDRPSGARSAE